MRRTEQRGSLRGNWVLLSLIVVVLAMVAMFTVGGETASTAAQKFMVALGKGDAATLTDMSYFNPAPSKEEIRKMWDNSLSIGRYYKFVARLKSQASPVPGRATVAFDYTRDADKSAAFTETFSLDLLQIDGKWKVDVRSLSREMYPALPR